MAEAPRRLHRRGALPPIPARQSQAPFFARSLSGPHPPRVRLFRPAAPFCEIVPNPHRFEAVPARGLGSWSRNCPRLAVRGNALPRGIALPPQRRPQLYRDQDRSYHSTPVQRVACRIGSVAPWRRSKSLDHIRPGKRGQKCTDLVSRLFDALIDDVPRSSMDVGVAPVSRPGGLAALIEAMEDRATQFQGLVPCRRCRRPSHSRPEKR